jgi:hypothetical protein
MAIINYTTSYGSGMHFVLVQWDNMAVGDTGDPIMLPEWADKTVTATGTLGGATAINLQGSNNKVDWFNLSDPQGTAINLVTGFPSGEAVLENPLWIRPSVTGGAANAIDVYVTCTQKRAR